MIDHHFSKGQATSRPDVRVVGLEASLRELFCSAQHPRQRLAQASRLLHPPAGLEADLAPALGTKQRLGFAVQQVVRLDGYEVRAMQQGWGLFNPTRRVELTAWAYDRFETEMVVERIQRAIEVVARSIRLPRKITVGLLPSDPANFNLMVHCGGVSTSGESPGFVLLQIWPDEGNLERLEALVLRCLVEGLLNSRRTPKTLAEFLQHEGLVTQALVELDVIPSQWKATPWLLALAAPEGHERTLAAIAAAFGCVNYGDIKTNVYGNLLDATDFADDDFGRSPRVPSESSGFSALTEEDVDYTRQVLSDQALRASGEPHVVAGALYGDPPLRRYGYRGLGLSRCAGLQMAFEDARLEVELI